MGFYSSEDCRLWEKVTTNQVGWRLDILEAKGFVLPSWTLGGEIKMAEYTVEGMVVVLGADAKLWNFLFGRNHVIWEPTVKILSERRP